MDIKNKSTLILDDSRSMRDMLRIHLGNLGLNQVRMADTVAEAMREIKERHFDIILCDYHLGSDRNGQQFLEELRNRNLIRLSDVFIMVTSEQQYDKVISVAEYTPDDYLIKPFVSSVLEQRIMNAFEKKDALRPILSAMDAGDYKKAIAECQYYLNHKPGPYARYVERLRAESYLHDEDYEHAAHSFEEILADHPVAWAELGLGKALHHLGDFERATSLIEHVCDSNPMYLESYDSLAKVHEAAGNDAAAESAVDRAIERSPLRLDRHARLGELALRTGNLDKAEKAFTKVVNDGIGSCYHAPEAYLRLAEIHTAKGNSKKAAEVLSKIEGHFENAPDAKFCSAVAKIDMANQEGDLPGVIQAFDTALQLLRQNPGLVLPESARLRFGCEALDLERNEIGENILRDIFQNSSRPELVKKTAFGLVAAPGSNAKLRILFDDFHDEIDNMNEMSQDMARRKEWDEAIVLATEAANRLKNNVDVLLSAAQIHLMRMEHKGWDEVRLPIVRKYLERARSINSKHPKLAAIELLLERVREKYGINAKARIHYMPNRNLHPLSDEPEINSSERT